MFNRFKRPGGRKLALITSVGAAMMLVASLSANAATTSQSLAGGDNVTVNCLGSNLTVEPVDALTVLLTCAPNATTTTTAPPPTTTTTVPPPPPTTTTTIPTPPPVTGWPGASNTGVPAGVVLHTCTSPITVAGTYDSCRWTGGLSIRTSGVTITRSEINGQTTGVNQSLFGTTFTDVTIKCNCGSTNTTTPPAIAFSDFTLTRVNISGSGHGVQIVTNVLVQDSFIHDLCCSNGGHKDGIISNGGGNTTIRHNNVECVPTGCSAAFGLFGDFAPIANWTIDNNLFNTDQGGYCAYGGNGPTSKAYPNATNVKFTNNHFGRKYNPKCGYYGPIAYNGGAGSVWSGNVWDDTGLPVS